MYRPVERLFAFRIRRTKAGDVLEGVSRRYTAMALIGLAGEADEVAREILAGQTRQEVCGGLVAGLAGCEALQAPAELGTAGGWLPGTVLISSDHGGGYGYSYYSYCDQKD